MDLNQFNLLIANWSHLSIPIAVLVASVLGSSHCVSMCSPIAIIVKNRNGYLSLYHLGRLLSYIILGALAGLIGKRFLSDNHSIISLFSITLISIFMVLTGLKLVRMKSIDWNFLKRFTPFLYAPMKWALKQKPVLKSLTIGFVNGFIPCGWLYIFVVGAIATKNPFYGAFLITLFWIGTIPALTFFSIITNKVIFRLPINLHRVAGLVLIITGLTTIFIHAFPSHDFKNSSHHNSVSIIQKTDHKF